MLIHVMARRFGSYLKGYTVGTAFVLLHMATHELRLRRLDGAA